MADTRTDELYMLGDILSDELCWKSPKHMNTDTQLHDAGYLYSGRRSRVEMVIG